MEYRKLGRSGLKISALSFGAWVTFKNQLDVDKAVDCMTAAWNAGVNFFDNAEAYAGGMAEKIMGEVFQKQGWSRDSFIVSSKVFWGGDRPTQKGLSRKHVTDACHSALNRLQLDYLDLYLCHRPDQDTPVEETVWAMNDLMRQGKILYWGTSEWPASKIMEAWGVAQRYNLIGPSVEQPQYNMFHRERVEVEYLRCYESAGIGTTIWSPLASGLLTGKYNDGIPDDSRLGLENFSWLKEHMLGEGAEKKIAAIKELGNVAKDLSISLPQLALAWCLKNPHVSTVITGASRAGQVTENMKAIEAISLLNDEIMAKIETILDNKPTPEPSF